MRIVVCHSAHERCGVGQYGRQLDRSLSKFVEVAACSYHDMTALAAVQPGDVALFHFEPGLVGDDFVFRRQLATVRARGGKIVFCCHLFHPGISQAYGSSVDLFVLHRTYYDAPTNSVQIPLGCPTYTPSTSREELRVKFGLPADKVVLTTVGFLTQWKRTPEVAEAVLAATSECCFVHLQTPWPFDVGGAGACREDDALRAIMARYPGRGRLATDFLPEEELLDLVHASDLGFVFHGIDTGSVSAATKQFVSARCPLVVTGSTHSSDIIQGVRRVGSFDPAVFASEVARVAGDLAERARLSVGIDREYKRINMDTVAKRYVERLNEL